MKSPIDRLRRKLLHRVAALPMLPGVSMLSSGADAACAVPAGAARSLVCIFLAGGADSFNMFVPGGTRYDEYRATRNDLAVPEDELLGVSDAAQGSFGFNAAMPAFAGLYRENRLAVVSNVGPLIRPTARSDYLGSVNLPQSLFVHNTQQKLWQTGTGMVTGSDAFGWGGAISDHAAECNGCSILAPSVSTAGNAEWLESVRGNYVSLNPNVPAQRMDGYDNIPDYISRRRLGYAGRTLEELIAVGRSAPNSLLMRAISNGVARATDATEALFDSLQANRVASMSYNQTNSLANQMHLVARLIASRERLGMSRQVFFVKMDGWDTHSNQDDRLLEQLSKLDEAVGGFQGAIDDLGVADSVTGFTASDFGRTLTSNGTGTDHGWGGHGFVFGGAVNGGRVVGDTPSYSLRDNPDDAGEQDGSFAGRIIPRVSVNQYAASLTRWMGVPEWRITAALPDLANFAEKDLSLFRIGARA